VSHARRVSETAGRLRAILRAEVFAIQATSDAGGSAPGLSSDPRAQRTRRKRLGCARHLVQSRRAKSFTGVLHPVQLNEARSGTSAGSAAYARRARSDSQTDCTSRKEQGSTPNRVASICRRWVTIINGGFAKSTAISVHDDVNLGSYAIAVHASTTPKRRENCRYRWWRKRRKTNRYLSLQICRACLTARVLPLQ
jgi:hypothetical protein